MIKVRQTPHQSPMLKMLEDKFLQSAPDTQAYNTLVKAHMEWLCKCLILGLFHIWAKNFLGTLPLGQRQVGQRYLG